LQSIQWTKSKKGTYGNETPKARTMASHIGAQIYELKKNQYCKEFIEHFERTYPYKSSIRAKIQRFTKDALYNFICKNIDVLRKNQYCKEFIEHFERTDAHKSSIRATIQRFTKDALYNFICRNVDELREN